MSKKNCQKKWQNCHKEKTNYFFKKKTLKNYEKQKQMWKKKSCQRNWQNSHKQKTILKKKKRWKMSRSDKTVIKKKQILKKCQKENCEKQKQMWKKTVKETDKTVINKQI